MMGEAMTASTILTHRVDVTRIPATGQTETFSADEARRTALAAAYGLVEVRSLIADMSVAGSLAEALIVDGRVRADIVQTCVVSLEPVEQRIDEAIDMRFVPPGSPRLPAAAKPGSEVEIEADVEDPPEILAGTILDLGKIAEEHFVLAIDPYPRAPGATLPPEATDQPSAGEDSPFAVLAGFGRDPKKG